MAHTDVSNTFVGVPKVTGGIWRYSQNIVLPTTAYAPRPVNGTRLGGVSEDGVTWMTERQTDKKKDWNGDKVRSIQQNKDDKFKITYIEFLNPSVIAEVFGDENVTVTPSSASHGTHIAAKSVADVPGHHGYIVDTFDGPAVGGVKRRRVLPDAQVESIEDVAEKPGDWSVYTVTYDLFPDSQGVTNHSYTELGDIWVPTEWDADIAGVAGTVIYTVGLGGESDDSTAVAYNAITSVLTTALEALSTVGAGNVTVGGSAGAYEIALARGGALSAVGSGGATATVEQTA